MKTKQFLFLICTLLLFSGTVGCDKTDKEDELPKELIGRWQLAGFGNEANNSFREAEPEACKHCFVIQFFKDNTARGVSIFNRLFFYCKCNGSNISFSGPITMTEVFENEDGSFFTDNLAKVSHFSINDSQLNLFYSKTEYMLFNKIKD